MINKNERKFMDLLEEAERYAKGELELDCVDGEWFVMDYREDLGGAFPIKSNGFDEPIITDEEAKIKGIDIIECCDELGIAYVG